MASYTLPGKAKDLTNKRFGRLVAMLPIRKNHYNGIVWKCKYLSKNDKENI